MILKLFNDILSAFLPEMILIVVLILHILGSLFLNKFFCKYANWLSVAGIIISFCSMCLVQISPNYYAFHNACVSNIFTLVFKVLILIVALSVLFLSFSDFKRRKDKVSEFNILLLGSVISAMVLVSCNDFISMFVALEFLAMTCYFLCGFRDNYKAKEGALKYAITGSVASCILLLGVSYLYGFSHSVNFDSVYKFLINWQNMFPDMGSFIILNPQILLLSISTFLIVIGLTFKIGSIPFSNWIPDAYEGASYPVSAYLSLIPKIAAFGILSRLLVYLLDFALYVKVVLAFIALVSVVIGNLGAIRQINLKRFMGYSSIAHSGYILLGLSVLSVYSLSTVIFYLITYIFMNVGAWAGLNYLNRHSKKENLNSLKGLYYVNPYFSIALTVCFVALAGLPVTSGFLAKIYLFSSVARSGFIFLPFLILILIATVIGVYMYFKIIKLMFEKIEKPIYIAKKMSVNKFLLYFCSVLTVLICIFADKIIQLSQIVAYYI